MYSIFSLLYYATMPWERSLHYSIMSFLQVALLQQYPQLKQCIKPSVEKAVQDLLALVVERSIKVAITTTEHIIKKVL